MTQLHSIIRVVALAIAALVPCLASAAQGVTAPQARAIALAQVPGGTIESAELEHEGGKHVWSFDIRSPDSPNVVEVQVEAGTGHVVSRKLESPADQAKEALADRKEKARAHAAK